MSSILPTQGTLQAVAEVSLPDKTASHTAAVEAWVDYFSLLKSLPQTRHAYVGNGSGVVNVADRPMFKYIRLGSLTGGVAEARNLPRLDPANNDVVLVRRERPGGLGPWQIIDWYGSGSVPVLDCEACNLTFQSQIIIKTFDADEAAQGDTAVYVKEHWAYVVRRGRNHQPGGAPEGDAVLETYDLSNPASPALSSSLNISTPGGTTLGAVGICGIGDDVWVSGFYYDGVTLYVDQPKVIIHYDISTRSSPSYVSEWHHDTMYSAVVVPFRHWDGSAYVGDPYLIWYNFIDAINSSDTIFIDNGLSGATVGSIGGQWAGIGAFNFMVPVVCGDLNIALVSSWTTGPPGVKYLTALDISNPASPAVLWTDANVDKPEVYLGSNRAYAHMNSSNPTFGAVYVAYTQVSVDATRSNLTPGFGNSHAGGWGYYLDGNCLFHVGNQSVAVLRDISTLLNPPFVAAASAPVTVTPADGDAQFSAADKEGSTIYLAHVGIHQSGGVWYDTLTVFTN